MGILEPVSWREVLDNLVHLGHNVVVGEDCLLCGQTGVAGSVKMGSQSNHSMLAMAENWPS